MHRSLWTRWVGWSDQNTLQSNSKVFKIDDIFITGILAEKANVTHRYKCATSPRFLKACWYVCQATVRRPDRGWASVEAGKVALQGTPLRSSASRYQSQVALFFGQPKKQPDCSRFWTWQRWEQEWKCWSWQIKCCDFASKYLVKRHF